MHIFLHLYVTKLKTKPDLTIFIKHTESTKPQYFTQPIPVSHVKLLYHVTKHYNMFG